jgi:hypothetical protein
MRGLLLYVYAKGLMGQKIKCGDLSWFKFMFYTDSYECTVEDLLIRWFPAGQVKIIQSDYKPVRLAMIYLYVMYVRGQAKLILEICKDPSLLLSRGKLRFIYRASAAGRRQVDVEEAIELGSKRSALKPQR